MPSTRSSLELLEKLKGLSAVTRISMSRLLGKAVEDLILKYNTINTSSTLKKASPFPYIH
ncbi:ribbon-helix-helix domain-containing protein [Niallia oryzisoli]|uniref:ribbon-helix-helix domain-containing protein n=1 Tax=Niallia oryzisoli TaxID=1737571 RepID=UPI003BB11799